MNGQRSEIMGRALNTTLDTMDRARLAQLTMDILEEWRLAPEDQLKLLGSPDKLKPRHLSRYRNGDPFPEDTELLERARHVLGIQEALHLVFALNYNMPGVWLKQRNRILKGIPLEIMLNEGLNGMHRVWRHLDCTINWE
jgi:hypothetical protein